jgi:hypothetical protein
MSSLAGNLRASRRRRRDVCRRAWIERLLGIGMWTVRCVGQSGFEQRAATRWASVRLIRSGKSSRRVTTRSPQRASCPAAFRTTISSRNAYRKCRDTPLCFPQTGPFGGSSLVAPSDESARELPRSTLLRPQTSGGYAITAAGNRGNSVVAGTLTMVAQHVDWWTTLRSAETEKHGGGGRILRLP